MDDRELLSRVHSGLHHIIGFFAGASSGARSLRWLGMHAAIVPSTPERSLFNGAQFASLEALSSNYAELEAAYRDAGVRAFSVWLDPGDAAQAAFLEARGHKLDGKPVAMAAELSNLQLPAAGDLLWSVTRDAACVAAINEQAYGFPAPAWASALTQLNDPRAHVYIASVHGQPAASVIALDGDFGDCVIASVATAPEQRHRQLASRLLAQALRDAQSRGAVSTSLQSSSKGRAVYARLGYRELGAMELWERRF